jgi:hypothetical protein
MSEVIGLASLVIVISFTLWNGSVDVARRRPHAKAPNKDGKEHGERTCEQITQHS